MTTKLKQAIVSLTLSVFVGTSHAMSMQELFDQVNAQGNVTNPSILQGQTMNMYNGGSLFMRMPRRTYPLATMTAPSWNAGCGGIDLFLGGFSFINKEQFIAMMRNIGSNALGYGFKLAIQNLCPTCDNVMQALQATAQFANRQNIDSCETAKGLVNAALPDTWTRGRQNTAKNFGVNMNAFADLTDAWTNVMNNESRANEVVNQAKTDPVAHDTIPSGNVVWKALKKLDGIDDEHRMVLMSMIGSVIFDTNRPSQPMALLRKEITVETLVGSKDKGGVITVPIWRCDTKTPDGCLHPIEEELSTKSFVAMVRDKLTDISNHIADRSAHADPNGILAFLSVTDLPVYKMLAVSTSLKNTQIAEALIGRFQELIAAKYAEVYLQRAVTDLRNALSKYSLVADASQTQALERIDVTLEDVSRSAREVLAKAHSQTVSTLHIAQEIQHMERVLNANLSETVRNSLAFGRSLH